MLTVLFEGTCPNCGCHDVRSVMWVGYKCFKCGHIEPYQNNNQKWEG